MSGSKRPVKSVQRESLLDMIVFCNINIIIEINEVVLIHLPENGKCNYSQNDINDKCLSLGTDSYFVKHGLLSSPAAKSSRFFYSPEISVFQIKSNDVNQAKPDSAA
jgi:hypothetical protein